MEMQVEHTLPGLLADVGHDAEAFQSQLLGNLGDHLKAVRHNRTVARVHRGNRLNVLLGDHEKMRRRLWVDVIKGLALLVLIDLVRGDLPRCSLAKQTLCHLNRSFLFC